MPIFFDDFNYTPTVSIVNSSTWTGDTRFKGLTVFDETTCWHGNDTGGWVNQIINHVLPFTEVDIIVEWEGTVGWNSYNNTYTHNIYTHLIANNGGRVGFRMEYSNQPSNIIVKKLFALDDSGWEHIATFDLNRHIPYHIKINLSTNEYLKFIFDGVDYKNMSGSLIGDTENVDYFISAEIRSHMAAPNGSKSKPVWDYIKVYTEDITKKYLKFPRWHPTKYGMRPWY